MAVEGKIASAALGELPLTWKALAGSPDYGDPFLKSKIELVKLRLFGEVISVDAENALDIRVIDYAGKLVALQIINPGIDYWGKQPLSIGATGRNENKAYTDRARDLRDLRVLLLEQTRLLFREVEALLPGRQFNTVSNVPRVQDIENAHTPSPYDFEPAFAPSVGRTT